MITWTLKDINEANAILSVLRKLPMEQVEELVLRLKDQTQRQVNAPDPPT